MPGLVLKEVSKSFGSTVVLDRVSLELAEGELLVVLGPSGCGKSTLLRLISGLEECDSGEIYVNDRRVDQLRPRERNVALVFQNYSLYPHMSVAKESGVSAAGRPDSRKRRSSSGFRRQLRCLDWPNGSRTNRGSCRAASVRGWRWGGRSSGSRRYFCSMNRSPISMPSFGCECGRRSSKLQRQLGRTMIHVTHDQTEALTMADRIALLDKGKLIQVGTPEELYRKPATSFVASFIGQPKINLVEVTASNGRTEPFDIETSHSGRFLLGIRPESIVVDGSGKYEGRVGIGGVPRRPVCGSAELRGYWADCIADDLGTRGRRGSEILIEERRTAVV